MLCSRRPFSGREGGVYLPGAFQRAGPNPGCTMGGDPCGQEGSRGVGGRHSALLATSDQTSQRALKTESQVSLSVFTMIPILCVYSWDNTHTY